MSRIQYIPGVLFQLALVVILLSLAVPARAQTEEPPVVQAVLFYSPSCGHCQQVINQVLPPLLEQYGDQLVILGIDVTQPAGATLYQLAIETIDFRGVPLLFVGDEVMLGSAQIPAEFPGLIEQYLAQGGIGWPELPGLAEALGLPAGQAEAGSTSIEASQPVTQTERLPIVISSADPTAAPTALPTPVSLLPFGNIDMLGNFNQDRVGGILALVVLIGMVLVVMLVLPSLWRITETSVSGWRVYIIPLLALLGMGVAGYLAFIETSQATAYCGPVGDCNAVQQSEYAYFLGIPVGILGMAGYFGILLAWAVSRIPKFSVLAALAIFLMALGGVLFSIYLTFLEPFVIGAVCIWCLTSAVLMGGLLISATWYYQSQRYRSLMIAVD